MVDAHSQQDECVASHELSDFRKFVLFGLLRDKDGNVIGPDSPHYANLGIGETIGGPFEDTTGPVGASRC